MNVLAQNLLIALRSLGQHRGRTALLGGLIALVTALLIFLLGLAGGAQRALFNAATVLQSGHIMVGGVFKHSPGKAAPLLTAYPEVAAVIRAGVSDVDRVRERTACLVQLASDHSSAMSLLWGVTVQNERELAELLQLKAGSLEALREPGTLLLFEQQAQQLRVEVGDSIVVSTDTPRGTRNALDLRVVAIAKNAWALSGFQAFASNATVSSLYNLGPGVSGGLLLFLRSDAMAEDPNRLRDVAGQVRTVLTSAGYELLPPDGYVTWYNKMEQTQEEGWVGQRLDVSTWTDNVWFLLANLNSLRNFSGWVVSLLLVLICIGLMNNLWILIRERRREIGTMRAIGMQRSTVVGLIVTEATVLALIASVTGVVGGYLVCLALNAWNIAIPEFARFYVIRDTFHFSFDARMFPVAVAVITGSVALISLVPALVAARLPPTVAINHRE